MLFSFSRRIRTDIWLVIIKILCVIVKKKKSFNHLNYIPLSLTLREHSPTQGLAWCCSSEGPPPRAQVWWWETSWKLPFAPGTISRRTMLGIWRKPQRWANLYFSHVHQCSTFHLLHYILRLCDFYCCLIFLFVLFHTVLWSLGQPLSSQWPQYRYLRLCPGPDRTAGDEVLI